MFVECFKNNGTDYLRLVKSQRVINAKGVKTATKLPVFHIGPLARFDDGAPDYVKRLKQSFKAGVPLIPSLAPYCTSARSMETYRFSMTEGSPDCFGHPKLFSHRLIEKILEELELHTFFSSYKGFTKLTYDVYGFAKLLIFGRILHPASKYATVRQNDEYYEPILGKHNPDNIYDTLSFIAANKDKIMRRMNTNLVKKAGRSPDIIYYNVTNFYFEIEEPDEDILDDAGNVLDKGQRKMGVSKENRKQPIVQMGLFMDDNGIPIAVESFPGNTLDHLTLRPALQKSLDRMDFARFILIADRGICQYRNLLHVPDAGNGYIVSKSLLKSAEQERRWAYDAEGYTHVGNDFKYKARIVKRTVKDENGSSRVIEEKVVVYRSRKFQMRGERENKKFLDFLKKPDESPGGFRMTALQAKSLRKFLRKDCVNKETGEIVASSDIKALIDLEKVDEYTKGMGYYQIVSSELTLEAPEIIQKYHGLTQIEDQFRVMKGVLETRPLFVRDPEHVDAHLLLCMIALVVLRIIQRKIISSGQVEVEEDAYWSTGLNGNRIREALGKWKIDRLPGDWYRFMDADDPDLKLILDAFGLGLPAKLYRRAELKSLKHDLKIFM